MEALVNFLVSIVSIALGLMQFLLMIRAILSWFPFDDSSPLVLFVSVVTEPIILPVRQMLDKVRFFAELPIDLSLFITYLLLTFISLLLPQVHF